MVQKCPIFVNVYTIEIVNAEGWVVKKGQYLVIVVFEHPLDECDKSKNLTSVWAYLNIFIEIEMWHGKYLLIVIHTYLKYVFSFL